MAAPGAATPWPVFLGHRDEPGGDGEKGEACQISNFTPCASGSVVP